MQFINTRHLTRELWFASVLFVISILLAFALLLIDSSSSEAKTLKSNADAKTIQTNGRVSAVLKVGNRIYIGGTFLNVNGAPRARLAAIDARTGKLTSWNPGANSWVMTLAASPDGKRIYAGGTFSTVGGSVHNRLAAINAQTGNVENSWNPSANNSVRSLEVRGGRIYLGGDFTTVNGQSRSRLAAVNSLGTLIEGWRPTADDSVWKVDTSSDGSRVYIGGDFDTISGRSRPNLASVSAQTGVPGAWRPKSNRPVLDLIASGKQVYTAEGGPGGAISAYRTGTGQRVWSRYADGDAQTITVFGGRVYVGGHFDTVAGQGRSKLVALTPAKGALDPKWKPRSDDGVWDLTPDAASRKLYAGGDFTRINSARHQGFARFSSR